MHDGGHCPGQDDPLVIPVDRPLPALNEDGRSISSGACSEKVQTGTWSWRAEPDRFGIVDALLDKMRLPVCGGCDPVVVAEVRSQTR